MLIDIKHWPKTIVQIAHDTSDISRVSKKKKKGKQTSLALCGGKVWLGLVI
jgi:hypothetical protein